MERSTNVLTVASAYPLRQGNLVRPWIDGVPAFRRIGEAIDAARSSVWVTVAFLREGFSFPDGRGGLFDVLDSAVDRGVEVRVVLWQPGEELESYRSMTFWGSPEHRRWLADRGTDVKIRWDRAGAGFCQHQKTWVIDAGLPGEIVFVGGINCNPRAVVDRAHTEVQSTHDAYVELRGPSATDVHHNFVQR